MRPNGAIIGVLGLWMIVAGFVGLGAIGNVWNDLIVGFVVAILGFAMAGAEARAQGIVAGVMGLSLIVAAFIPGLRLGVGARWYDIAVGTILAVAGFSTPRRRVEAEVTRDIERAA
jgi:hypothetical protein